MRGLSVNVFVDSNGGDFTLGGVSSDHNNLILLGDRVAGVFSPSEEIPAVLLVERVIYGNTYLSAVPCDSEGEKLAGQYAFGGNFIYTSDSRFPSKQPIPIHDRNMNKENR